MGMVLSAVGACLLFILKVVGILLLILLVLAALLLLCPFCADVCWQNDTLTVKAGALGITFPVFQYPKPEPPAQPEEPKGFTGRLKAKFRAWRAERKRKKAEKKAAQPAKPKAEKPPRQKAKITLDVICTMLRAWVRCCGQCLARSALQGFRSALVCAGTTPPQLPAITASCKRGCTRPLACWTISSFWNLTSCAFCRTSAAPSLLCRTRCPSGSAHRRCSSSLPLCGYCTSSGVKKYWTFLFEDDTLNLSQNAFRRPAACTDE